MTESLKQLSVKTTKVQNCVPATKVAANAIYSLLLKYSVKKFDVDKINISDLQISALGGT